MASLIFKCIPISTGIASSGCLLTGVPCPHALMDAQRIMFIPNLIVGLLAFASFFNFETRKCVSLYSDTGKVPKLLRVAFYLLLEIICVLGLGPTKSITVLVGVAFIFNLAADVSQMYLPISSC
jgi:hypothetical protein